MKKLLLLVAFGFITLAAIAQQQHPTPASSSEGQSNGNVAATAPDRYLANATGAANKTTSGGYRWYNYARGYIDTTEKLASAGTNYITGRTVPMWQDTNLVVQGIAATWNVNLVSVADIFDPMAHGFNDSTIFGGLLAVTGTDTYTIDSIAISGKYRFNPAKTTIVDTLRLSFVKGAGGPESSDDIFSGRDIAASHYGMATVLDLHYDSVQNYARHTMAWGTPSDNVKDIILTSANWADTLSDGTMVLKVQLPTPFTGSVHVYAGMSISFISGDPAIPVAAPFDTLVRSDGSYKYNVFEPMIDFIYNGMEAQWPPYIANDHNAGYYKLQPSWADGSSQVYMSHFAFSLPDGARHYTYQYPEISWHIHCPSCSLLASPHLGINQVNSIDKVQVFPNPASGQLNIPFSLSRSEEVSISVSNMLGQVVASQYMGNVVSGTAVINTSAMPDGVYSCTISAGGERNTSKIAITH